MSTATQPERDAQRRKELLNRTQHHTYECAHSECDVERDPKASVGSFCSQECHYRDRGRKVLDELKRDHRFCATCFSIIKEVQAPSDDWVEEKSSKIQKALDNGAAFTGGKGGQLVLDCTGCDDQSRPVATDAVIGLQSSVERTLVVTDEEPLEESSWRRRRLGRWGCQCGNVDHRHRDDVLERVEQHDVLLNLLYVLFILFDESRVAHRPSKDALFNSLREHGRDWEQAIGRAIYE